MNRARVRTGYLGWGKQEGRWIWVSMSLNATGTPS